MKLSILQENLKQGLFVVSHIAGKNINLPILNNIMIKAEKGDIKLISTNLEVGIIYKLRGKIEEDGVYTVDSKILADYISLLPNYKTNLIKKDDNIVIECKNFKTKIKGMSAEDYPLIPKVESKKSFSVNIEEFKKALSQVVFAVSNNESRLELSGVLLNFNNNKLTLAATDSYRLAEKEIDIKTEEMEDKKIIIPSKTLQELIRIMSGLKEGGEINEEIKFYISDNQILFSVNSTELISRLIEGQYPDYKQIIPTNKKTSCTVNRSELIRAVKASALFSKTGINDVSLDFPKDKNTLVVTSASGQTGENTTNIEASVKGEDNGIMVNCNYLLDGLNNINDENVVVEVVDNNTPCVLKGEKSNTYLYIIMPIKQ